MALDPTRCFLPSRHGLVPDLAASEPEEAEGGGKKGVSSVAIGGAAKTRSPMAFRRCSASKTHTGHTSAPGLVHGCGAAHPKRALRISRERKYGSFMQLRRRRRKKSRRRSRKKEKKKKKKEGIGCNSRTSREVTHPSTTLAQARLTAEF